MRVYVESKLPSGQVMRIAYSSMKEACGAYGMSPKRLKENYNIVRKYGKGYWANVDAEVLKQIGKANSPEARCLIADD